MMQTDAGSFLFALGTLLRYGGESSSLLCNDFCDVAWGSLTTHLQKLLMLLNDKWDKHKR